MGSNDLSLHEVELSGKSRSTPILTVRCSFQQVFSQFDAAELIRYMITKPQRRQPDQTHLKLLQMSGDVEAGMLKVKEHSELLSAQYLVRCLEPGNVCHPITTRVIPERQMKETLYTRHRNTVEPMMVKNDRKPTLQALHTAAVAKAVQCHERNVVLDGRPPPISNSEKELTRKER